MRNQVRSGTRETVTKNVILTDEKLGKTILKTSDKRTTPGKTAVQVIRATAII